MFKVLSLVLISCLVSVQGFAAANTAMSKEALVEMAKEYHLTQATKSLQANRLKRLGISSNLYAEHRRCDDRDEGSLNSSCIENVCAKLGTYGCDEQRELKDVAMICANVDNSDCMNRICTKLGTYGCDEISEIKNVAQTCENIRSPRCIDQTCDRLGTYGCDELSEIQNVTRVCSGIRDTGCIQTLCEKLGTYGCDELREIEGVAKICRGQ